MQLMLIVGIACAIAAVGFALQNSAPVTVVFALWRFDSSLAVVLLLALGLGVIITASVTSPAMIKYQWTVSRLRRKVSELESGMDALGRHAIDLEQQLARLSPEPRLEEPDPKPYVGLKALITGGKTETPEK